MSDLKNDLENCGIEFEEGAINFGDESKGLADFMEVDVSEVKADAGGFSLTPAGHYKFSVDAIKVGTTTRRMRDTNEEFKCPNISLQFKIEEVISVADQSIDEASLIGRKHSEFVAVDTTNGEYFSKAVGKLKAMAEGMGGDVAGLKSPTDILKAMAGKSFTAKIKKGSYKNKDGERVETADLDIRSMKPAE